MKLSVDYENNSEAWWDAAREDALECPHSAREILRYGTDEIDVDAAAGAAFIAWASTLPGWNDGPGHAPHPIRVRLEE